MGNKEFTDMKYAELERQLKTIKITFQDSTGGNDRCRSISIPQENGDIITVLCPNSIVHDIVKRICRLLLRLYRIILETDFIKLSNE